MSICIISTFLTAISGCDSRMKFALFQYELSECPSEMFSLPSPVLYQKWEVKTIEPPRVCSGANYFIIADEKLRSGGGFGLMEGALFYTKIIQGKSCSILLAFPYDKIADKDPKKNLIGYANDAVNAFFQNSIKVKFPEVKYEIIEGSNDFKKWCME